MERGTSAQCNYIGINDIFSLKQKRIFFCCYCYCGCCCLRIKIIFLCGYFCPLLLYCRSLFFRCFLCESVIASKLQLIKSLLVAFILSEMELPQYRKKNPSFDVNNLVLVHLIGNRFFFEKLQRYVVDFVT